jgi:SHS2 domain-containing protein
MMDLDGFTEAREKPITVKANDLLSLVYSFLDEWLFLFDTDDFVLKRIQVTSVDLATFTVEATGYGETFEMEKHENFRRTEVKAITYASMQVDIKETKTDIYVIVDL